ncbi:MAG: PAS domain-containing hybrid sensor histidine kinase/response regulator [Endomicrobiales bacterium]
MSRQESRLSVQSRDSRVPGMLLLSAAGIFLVLLAFHISRDVFFEHLPFWQSHLAAVSCAAVLAAAASCFVLYAFRRRERVLRQSEARFRAGRRQMEDSLVREHEFTRALLDNMSDGVVACDANGVLVLFNRTVCEWHGRDAQALPSSEWPKHFDLYEPGGETPMGAGSVPLARALGGEYVVNAPMTIAVKGRPLRHVLASARPFYDGQGRKLGAVVVMTDITERKRTEEELRKNESFLDNIVDNLPNMIFVKDARELRFVRWNKAAEGLVGYSRESLLGKNDYDFFPPDEADHFVRKDREVLESGQLLDIPEEKILTKDRGERILHTRKIPLFDGKGNPQFLLGISEDITERKQMEAQKISMEKLKSLGLLAGGIAHDFNNLLSVIMGNISYARSFPSREKSLESLTDAKKACRRAKSLTHQLLTFAIGNEPVKRTVSIDELLRQTVKFFLSGSNIEPQFSLVDPWPVEIDVDQINQVIQNLVVNARDAMPDGGVLEVTSRNVQEREGRFLSIRIKDNGGGIPPEILDRIFDPYFSSKKTGTGLGLTIAYSIIQKHKGSITVDSRPGEGTVFTILLPASATAAPEEAPVRPLAGELKPVRGMRILVLDDEEGIRDMLERALESLGHTAVTSSNGDDTLRLFREAAQSGAPFDLVIMDLTIPGRRGGKDIIGEVLEIAPNVKTIVSSGYSEDPVMANFKTCGFHAILQKPYEIEELNEVLGRLLG